MIIKSTNQFRSSINELIEIISSSDVNSISATPTFWDIFKFRNAKKKDLKLLTLGGEIVEEDLLLKMKNCIRCKNYPNLRNNRAKKIFSVHDSKAGFPYEYLEKYGLKILTINIC